MAFNKMVGLVHDRRQEKETEPSVIDGKKY